MASIESTPFEHGDEAEGFLIVTAADKGLVDIHDHSPFSLVPEVALEWMRQDVYGKKVQKISSDGAVSAGIQSSNERGREC